MKDKTFNSLFEIRNDTYKDAWQLMSLAFNSLFEILEVVNDLIRIVEDILSILFLRFCRGDHREG